MIRFVVFGAVLTLGTLVTDWARAESCADEAARMALSVDDVDAGDVASYVEGCEYDRELAMVEVDSANLFYRAQAAVVAAPEFCAVTVVQRDATRGWVAVCELVSEGGAL